ncbi:hypothetical protein NMY22_g16718 [Coprinellus aureogranulatus]|nr:hypothetical protein NMY22_g16718 [Coprinellus aureogranulatus]
MPTIISTTTTSCRYLDVSFDNEPLMDFSALNFMQKFGVDSPAVQKTPVMIDVPSDILQSIFTFASSPGYDDPDLIDLRRSQAAITTCAQVCRAWRSAALAQKELWAALVDFQGQSVERLRHLLKISSPYVFNVGHRSAPVSFTGAAADPRSRNLRHLLSLLQEHQTRVREFHVDWFSFNKAFVVEGQRVSLTQLQMPRLEALSWYGTGPFDQASYFRMEPDGSNSPLFPLLPELPRLRRVVLHHAFGISKPLLSRCLTTLSELSLNSAKEAAHRLPVEQLADVLRGLENLQLLSLFNAVESGEGAHGSIVTRHLRPIVLPQLVHISLGASKANRMDAQIALLDAIIPSEACGVQLLLPYRFILDGLRQPLRQHVSRFFSSPFPGQEGGMRMHIFIDRDGNDRTCTLSNMSLFPLDAVDFGCRGLQGVLRSLGSVKTRPLTVRAPDILHAVYYLVPVGEEVTSVEFSLKGTMDLFDGLITFTGAFSIFPNATHLILHHDVAIEALRELSDISAQSSQQNRDLPSLRSLTLVSCKCTPDTDVFRVLTVFLEARRSVNRAIQEICFAECTVVKGELADLARLFGCDITIEPGTLDSSQLAQYEKYCSRQEAL